MLGPHSGAVIFQSDTLFIDGFPSAPIGNNLTLAMNEIAFAHQIPEPASLVLFGLGAIGVLTAMRRRVVCDSAPDRSSPRVVVERSGRKRRRHFELVCLYCVPFIYLRNRFISAASA